MSVQPTFVVDHSTKTAAVFKPSKSYNNSNNKKVFLRCEYIEVITQTKQ